MTAGTVLPKDPASMVRIIEIGNDLGELFHCVLPKRKKPYNAEWLDIPQVPVIEDICTEDAESHLRLSFPLNTSFNLKTDLLCFFCVMNAGTGCLRASAFIDNRDGGLMNSVTSRMCDSFIWI
jgi:hypothetical protein